MSKLNIRINFIGIKGYFLKKKIIKVFNEVARLCGIEDNFIVNVGYISENAIQKLNKEHRNVDKVTDVLSFPFFNLKNGTGVKQALDENKFDIMLNNYVELGDILICEQVAENQAVEYGHSKKREVCFLATHGFLHLLGFDHLNSQDEKIMNTVAEKALSSCKIERKK